MATVAGVSKTNELCVFPSVVTGLTTVLSAISHSCRNLKILWSTYKTEQQNQKERDFLSLVEFLAIGTIDLSERTLISPIQVGRFLTSTDLGISFRTLPSPGHHQRG